jgi:histidine triad (HIT) family protein
MKPCLFCQIAGGELPAAIVLDEPEVLGFLDISPVFLGHVLLIPRAHYVTLPELPQDVVTKLFTAAQRVAVGVQSAMNADGTWVSMNNVVSQSVPHLHVHVVPRKRKDGLRGFYWPRQKYETTDAMVSLAETISLAIAAHDEATASETSST